MLARARLAASIANVTVYEKILAAAPTATSLHHVPTVQGICFCLNQTTIVFSSVTGNSIEVTETPCHVDFNAWSKFCDDVDGKCTCCIKYVIQNISLL